MDKKEIDMTEEEDCKCRQIIALFSDFMQGQEALCVTKTDRYGYIVLSGIVDNLFESTVICQNATELFQELMDTWEMDYLFQVGLENGCEDFDSSKESMNEQQRHTWEKTRLYYKNELKRIVEGKI